MELPALRVLHQAMRSEHVDRTSFSYRNNQAQLDIVFIVDEAPFVLLIGARSRSPHSFELPVLPGYRVPLLFNEHLRPLMDALGIQASPASRFKTSLFLKDLNAHVPSAPRGGDLPTDLLAGRAAAADVEERDKVYFVGWVAHNDGRSVTDANLDKTRRILGAATMNRCRLSNISSRWSALPSDRHPITCMPD